MISVIFLVLIFGAVFIYLINYIIKHKNKFQLSMIIYAIFVLIIIIFAIYDMFYGPSYNDYINYWKHPMS